jgi:hypothetical protein
MTNQQMLMLALTTENKIFVVNLYKYLAR